MFRAGHWTSASPSDQKSIGFSDETLAGCDHLGIPPDLDCELMPFVRHSHCLFGDGAMRRGMSSLKTGVPIKARAPALVQKMAWS